MWKCPQASSCFALSEAASAREACGGRADAKLPQHAADCPPGLTLRPVRASPVQACVTVGQTDAPSLQHPFFNRVWYWTATTDQPVTQRPSSPTLWNVALELHDLITTAPGACRSAALTTVLQVLIRCWRSIWCAHGQQRLRKAAIFGTHSWFTEA